MFKAPVLEYCGGDTFSPSCQEGEILLIHQALYGRMKIGRCVTIDLGYIGCTSDALGWMDRKCSGKTTCEVRVPNRELKENLDCLPVDITHYLEVSSSCVPGMIIDVSCLANFICIFCCIFIRFSVLLNYCRCSYSSKSITLCNGFFSLLIKLGKDIIIIFCNKIFKWEALISD